MKVSVIIPAYNVGIKLEKSAGTFLRMNPNFEYEVIIVNDASTDDTKYILDYYQKKFDNLIVINKRKNGGVGAARNSGLAKARGEFVLFFDADDRPEPNMLQYLIDRSDGYDIVLGNFIRNNKEIEFTPTTDITKNKITALSPLWNKIIRRELLTKIKFTDYKSLEDIIFMYEVVRQTDMIRFTSQPLLTYDDKSEGSLTNNLENKLDAVLAYEHLRNRYHDCSDEILDYIKNTHVIVGTYYFVRRDKQLYQKYLELMKQANIKSSLYNPYIGYMPTIGANSENKRNKIVSKMILQKFK